jgi:hypothetical protein
MKIAVVKLKSTSPYSQGKNIDKEFIPKKAKETDDAFEKRTWRHRIHVTDDGFVMIPGSAFANSIKSSARRLKLQVPGKGRTEYAKYFEAGIMVPGDLKLTTRADDVPCDKLFVPSNGIRGGGKRVYKHFPRIDSWSGDVTFYIFDDVITEDVFTQVLRACGQLIGIGRFRPESCGYYGRFDVESIAWTENAEDIFAGAAE